MSNKGNTSMTAKKKILLFIIASVIAAILATVCGCGLFGGASNEEFAGNWETTRINAPDGKIYEGELLNGEGVPYCSVKITLNKNAVYDPTTDAMTDLRLISISVSIENNYCRASGKWQSKGKNLTYQNLMSDEGFEPSSFSCKLDNGKLNVGYKGYTFIMEKK